MAETYLPGQFGYGAYGYGVGAVSGVTVGIDDLILANQMANGHQHLGDKIHTASVNGIKETAEAARDTVDAVRDSINATNQLGNINLQATERNGGENRETTERASGVIRDHLATSFNQMSRDHNTIVSEICDVRQEMSTGFGATNLELTKQHADIKLEMCKQHNEIQRQIDARAAEAAKQLAECCCELKGQAAETRALILATDTKRVEAENANLRQELMIARLSGNGPGQGN